MIKERLIISMYGLSFLLIFLSIGFLKESTFCGQWFFVFGATLMFVVSLYNILGGIKRDEME